MKNRNGIKMVCMLLICLIMAGVIPAFAAPGYDQVAKNAQSKDVLTYGMIPVYGWDIQDGTYTLSVKTSSSFFKVLNAELTVKDGEMTAVLAMYSKSYEYLFMGTGEEAAQAELSEYLPCEDNGKDYIFTIPVKALNCEIPVTSFSVKKQKWYDRRILIDASGLPAEALAFDLPDYEKLRSAMKEYEKAHPEETEAEQETETGMPTTGEGPEAVEAEIADGEYSIEVNMLGGSGRASVSSPTWLFIRDGKAYAKLLWSSVYYDYMIVDGVTFWNETTDGSNSTFTIPITVFDEPMDVIADTTAMGDPVEIEYSLTFYYDTIADKGMIPQEAAKKVLLIALAIIAVGGIVNHVYKKKTGRY